MLVRKNIRMSDEVANWYEEKSNELGVSQSSLMVMALSEYIKQDKTINMMSSFESIISKIESMKGDDQRE